MYRFGRMLMNPDYDPTLRFTAEKEAWREPDGYFRCFHCNGCLDDRSVRWLRGRLLPVCALHEQAVSRLMGASARDSL